MIQERSELGQARVIFSPDLEVSLPQARELVAMLQYWSGRKGLTVTWRADDRSPDVLVQAKPDDLERLLARFPANAGGPGALDASSKPAPAALPAPTEPTEPTEPAAPAAPRECSERSNRRTRALIVSSDDSMREPLVMMGNVLGLDCEQAATYARAEARVRAEEYDLLIVAGLDVDVDRPGALLAALEPYLEMTTPVILWTEAFVADAPAWVEGLRAPLMLLSRPKDYEDFREKVHRALEWRHLVRLRRSGDSYAEQQVA